MRSLLLASLLLLSGCWATEVKDVLVIGDSVVVQSSRSLIDVGNKIVEGSEAPRILFSILAIGGTGAMTKDANNGNEYWTKLIPNVVEGGKFDAIVIELGWNDCGLYPDSLKNNGDYYSFASSIVNAIRWKDSNVPIYWQTTQHPSPCGDVVNNDITALVPTLPYKEWAQANPECFTDPVHLKSEWNRHMYKSGFLPTEKPPEGYCEGEMEYAKWLKAELDKHL